MPKIVNQCFKKSFSQEITRTVNLACPTLPRALWRHGMKGLLAKTTKPVMQLRAPSVDDAREWLDGMRPSRGAKARLPFASSSDRVKVSNMNGIASIL